MGTMKFFTVHENPDRGDPDERVLFVREGFNVVALIAPVIWLLYKRAWLGLPLYIAGAGLLMGLLVGTGIDPLRLQIAAGALVIGCPILLVGAGDPSLAALGLLFAGLCAFEANDVYRFMIARRGYSVTGIISGRSEIEAEQAYFTAHSVPERHSALGSDGPAGGAAIRRAGLWAQASEPILGLFPGPDHRG